MTALNFYQADSSDTLAFTVYSNDIVVADLTGYTGKFSVVKRLGDTPIFTKNMTVVEDVGVEQYRVIITPTESAMLSPGSWIGVAEIENSTLVFRREEHIQITVQKQGYVA